MKDDFIASTESGMRIFIAGNRGQLGRDAMEVLAAAHDVRGMDLPDLNITDTRSIEQCLAGWPQVILNCAAYTNVDRCESEPATAWAVNADGPRLLAEHARKHGAALFHISTDYVFDGARPLPQGYCEDDPTEPLSAYGRSKLAGELAIQASGCEFVIARTSWLYGLHGHNFLKTMLRLALTKPESTIKVVNDQYGCPTWSRRLAQQLLCIIDSDRTGILHTTGRGHCTWYELAKYFLETMKIDHGIVPCATPEYPTPARRPANSILACTRLSSANLHVMKHWKEDVDEFVARHHDRLIQEAEGALVR